MSFAVINGDITKIDCDMIVNSVGVTSTIYGGICGSIIKEAKSKELVQIIDKVNNYYTVGEYFITDGYETHAKHIYNLITPHYDNDIKYAQFKECIRRILNEANLRGYHDIAIPSIGTGANKYDKDMIRPIIIDMCSAYCDLYPYMNIAFILPVGEISKYNDQRLERRLLNNGQLHDDETLKKFKKGSKKFSETFDNPFTEYDYSYFDFDSFSKGRDNVVVDISGVKDIGDYVVKYVKSRCGCNDMFYPDESTIQQRINVYFAYGKKGKDTVTHAGSDAYGEIKYETDVDKKFFFRLMFALKMSVAEATEFLLFFGHSFAHPGVNKLDDAIRDLLNNHQYGIVEIELELKKRGIESFFKKQ